MVEPTEQEGRDVRADARDVRADARDARSDIVDTTLQDRGVRADVREDVVSEREGTVTGSIKSLRWLLLVLIVVTAGGVARTFPVQAAADKATKAAETAEKASNQSQGTSSETLAELKAITARLDAANEGEPDLKNQAIIDALQAVARIEGFICGGPCPEPDN